ncbi:MAG: methyltransferase domain-containing protein [Promethearchaeota archaeon]
MSSTSSWSKSSDIDPEKTKKMVEYIEKRSQYPDQKQVNHALKEILSPKAGERLLDAGCGGGVLSRLVAPNLAPGGYITGIDIFPEIIKLASEYARRENLTSLIRFEMGDAENLSYTDGYFDGAFAARLLLHVNNPQEVVRELTRVVRPGGRVVLMDWDFETLVVDHSNREITRRILHWRTDHKDGNNWSGRQLFRLLRVQGLTKVAVHTVVTVATDENSSLTQSLWHGASGALDQGIITEKEYKTWMSELKARLRDRQFFASIVYFIVRGKRP